MLDEARTHTAEQLYTDLASVPQFMLWFEPRYGRPRHRMAPPNLPREIRAVGRELSRPRRRRRR